MLHKKQKGEYGYLLSYRRGKLLVTMILAVMISAVILGTILMFGDTGRVMIVFAILLTLPFAKFLIAWIVCAKFRPFTKEQYSEFLENIAGDESLAEFLYYDVVVSQYEGMLFYQCICVKNGKIIAYSAESAGTIPSKKYKRWLENCMEGAKQPYPVTVFCDISAFCKKITAISNPNDQTARMDRYVAECILNTCV